jgi:uncharacterized protein
MVRTVILLCMVMVFEVSAASFDCTKAKTNVEKMICSDASLSALDDTLSEAYEDENATRGEEDTPLKAQQKAWLAARNKCSDKACVRKSYEARIKELACAKSNMGSARGFGNCNYLMLREAETSVVPLELQYARQVIAASDNPEYAKEVLAAESLKWREYRDANCALYGETEGGSDGWKNAWASVCALGETQKRIKALKRQIGKQ